MRIVFELCEVTIILNAYSSASTVFPRLTCNFFSVPRIKPPTTLVSYET